MKVGDLVREIATCRFGIVERVDIDYYGAQQAFKIYHVWPRRGHELRGDMVDAIGPTKDGKRDRVLVCWTDDHPEYLESTKLEVVNETR